MYTCMMEDVVSFTPDRYVTDGRVDVDMPRQLAGDDNTDKGIRTSLTRRSSYNLTQRISN